MMLYFFMLPTECLCRVLPGPYCLLHRVGVAAYFDQQRTGADIL